jgi:hypothetical protein
MNRKARVVVERERGEDNDGDDDFENDDIGKAEAVVKTTMTTTSDAHAGRRGRDDRHNNQKVWATKSTMIATAQRATRYDDEGDDEGGV